MTHFVTAHWPRGSGTNAPDDGTGGGKVQNVRRRRRTTKGGQKKGIKMCLLSASSASAAVPPLLLLFACCVSLVSSQPPYQRQRDDADTVAAEFVALQYPQARLLEGEEEAEGEGGLLPYHQSALIGQANGALVDNTVLQKRMLAPPERMMKLAQLMNKHHNGAEDDGRPKVPVDDGTSQGSENSAGDEESDSRRWRQSNGGMWSKRHIKDAASGFQKMDEFKNNMMRALINLRRYRR